MPTKTNLSVNCAAGNDMLYFQKLFSTTYTGYKNFPHFYFHQRFYTIVATVTPHLYYGSKNSLGKNIVRD